MRKEKEKVIAIEKYTRRTDMVTYYKVIGKGLF